MTANALRDELTRIDTVIEATRKDEAAAHVEIRGLARRAVGADAGDALARIKQAEGKLGSAKMAHRRLLDARAEVEGELCLALAQEAQNEREADAAEAEKFAESLPDIFRECDRHFAEFHKSFSAAIAAVNTGRSRDWSLPSAELVEAKLRRAVRTALSVRELAMLDLPPLPSSERTTFAQLGEAYGRSVRGGARASLTPPPVPQPTPSVAKSDEGRMPKRVDIMPVKEVDAEGFGFEIRPVIGR
jgi:hypothetical protein